jgi:pilus assembly protein CpaB
MRSGASIFILLVAIVTGGLAAVLARNWLASQTAQVAVVTSSTVVVAKDTLLFGATLTPDNITEIPWSSNTLPEGAVSSVDQLLKDGKRIVLVPFVRNEPIVGGKLTLPNQPASLATMIDPGMRAVTVSVDDVRGVAGFIFPGDYVDVVLTRGEASQVVLQHIKVLAIDQSAGERHDKPTVARAVTVEVSPEKSLKLLLAANSGRLSLILRKATEDAISRNTRVTQAQLLSDENASAPPKSEVVEAPKEKVVFAGAPIILPPTTRTVTVVRDLKGEEYVVPREHKTENAESAEALK